MQITFLGDLMLGKDQLDLYNRLGLPYDESFVFLKQELANSDYTIANLETPAAQSQIFTNLEADMLIMVNRMYNTENIQYDVKKEYFLIYSNSRKKDCVKDKS